MILIATALFPPEPVVSANLSFDIASALAVNNEVVVLSPKPSRPYGFVFDKEGGSNESFKHIVLNSYVHPQSDIFGRFKESYSLGGYLEEYISNNHAKISVIYANIWPLFSQNFLLNVALKYNIPVILHIQDIYPESLSEKISVFGKLINKFYLPMDKKNLQSAFRIVTISEKMKKYLSSTRSISEDKISVIRNWQNDSSFSNFQDFDLIKKGGNFIFLYLGTINLTAGVDLLIHAFSKADLTNASLIIAGDGPDKERCVQIAERYNKEIFFMSANPEQVPEIQSKADVLLLPLKKGVAKTALPSKMTAYMMSGRPIIASIDRDSEASEIIESSCCGWVTEAENEIGLIKCMKKARMTDLELLKKMGSASLKYAKMNFSKASNLNKISLVISKSKRRIALC